MDSLLVRQPVLCPLVDVGKKSVREEAARHSLDPEALKLYFATAGIRGLLVDKYGYPLEEIEDLARDDVIELFVHAQSLLDGLVSWRTFRYRFSHRVSDLDFLFKPQQLETARKLFEAPPSERKLREHLQSRESPANEPEREVSFVEKEINKHRDKKDKEKKDHEKDEEKDEDKANAKVKGQSKAKGKGQVNANEKSQANAKVKGQSKAKVKEDSTKEKKKEKERQKEGLELAQEKEKLDQGKSENQRRQTEEDEALSGTLAETDADSSRLTPNNRSSNGFQTSNMKLQNWVTPRDQSGKPFRIRTRPTLAGSEARKRKTPETSFKGGKHNVELSDGKRSRVDGAEILIAMRNDVAALMTKMARLESILLLE